MAFEPSGGFFFTERTGNINYGVDGRRRVIAWPADVVAQGEGGLMGIAVESQLRHATATSTPAT